MSCSWSCCIKCRGILFSDESFELIKNYNLFAKQVNKFRLRSLGAAAVPPPGMNKHHDQNRGCVMRGWDVPSILRGKVQKQITLLPELYSGFTQIEHLHGIVAPSFLVPGWPIGMKLCLFFPHDIIQKCM